MKKLSQKQIDIGKTIDAGIKKFVENGGKVEDGAWGTRMDPEKGYFVGKHACALGALLIAKNGSIKFDQYFGGRDFTDIEADETAAAILGVDQAWVNDFTTMFDEGDVDGPPQNYPEACGLYFRKKYVTHEKPGRPPWQPAIKKSKAVKK